ncbi:MAG: hypothetical protein AAGN35_17610 [Bacteroidota bacterium]
MADEDHAGGVRTEQVSIVLGENFILSFQEDPDDIFDPIRTALRNPGSRIRSMGPDYLAYLLLALWWTATSCCSNSWAKKSTNWKWR